MREKSPVPSASSPMCRNPQVQPPGQIGIHQICIVTAAHESALHTYTRAFPSDTAPSGAFTKGVSTPPPTRTQGAIHRSAV